MIIEIILTIAIVVSAIIGGFYIYDLGRRHGAQNVKLHQQMRVDVADLMYLRDSLNTCHEAARRRRLEKQIEMLEECMSIYYINIRKDIS